MISAKKFCLFVSMLFMAPIAFGQIAHRHLVKHPDGTHTVTVTYTTDISHPITYTQLGDIDGDPKIVAKEMDYDEDGTLKTETIKKYTKSGLTTESINWQVNPLTQEEKHVRADIRQAQRDVKIAQRDVQQAQKDVKQAQLDVKQAQKEVKIAQRDVLQAQREVKLAQEESRQ